MIKQLVLLYLTVRSAHFRRNYMLGIGIYHDLIRAVNLLQASLAHYLRQ